MDAELGGLLPEVDACQPPVPFFYDSDRLFLTKQSTINEEIEVETSADEHVKLMLEMTEEDSPLAPHSLVHSPDTPLKIQSRRFLSDEESLGDSSDYQSSSKQRSNRSRMGLKVKGYPTKNFLPNFKMPHLEYLYQNVSKELLARYPVVQEIHKKSGISMKDYQTLYSISAFTEVWRELFASRRLYLDLMTSRSSQEVKKIHQKKIAVFEKAFIKQEFNRIN
jgi:hypothetical protein